MYAFIYLFLERREGREKEGEKNTDQLPFIHAPAGDQTCDQGMCHDWESNQGPLVLRDNAH